MNRRTALPAASAVLVAVAMTFQPSARADTFGSGSNEFTIEFVSIGNPDNAPDTNGYGAVPYQYRIGRHEISQGAIARATAGGLQNVSAGAWSSNRPAASISWYEAAAFVNWLNTSAGKQAAYDLTWDGSSWSMALWSNADAWTLGGTNLYRHKDSYYFLPSENEWYKAAYFNPAVESYSVFATGENTAPIPVTGGIAQGTAVYGQPGQLGPPPAEVFNAGGLSIYGTMAQSGNVWELSETAFDGVNDSVLDLRATRGGDATDPSFPLTSSSRTANTPTHEHQYIGFRIASVPEPSTYALFIMTGAGVLWWARRRR